MNERNRILTELENADILPAIRWAFEAAARRTRDDYDDATGHNDTWIGTTRWVLLCDRLDRVFSCGKYATPEGGPSDAGLDILYATLTEDEMATFPDIPAGTVFRDDVVGSPGWSSRGVRWLLASAEFGGVNDIKWARRSPLKQRAAKQPDPDDSQMSIFDELTDPPSIQLREALARAEEFDVPTLVVTHTHDMNTDDRELFLGLPSLEDPNQSWAWKKDLRTTPQRGPGGRRPANVEPDGPVDLPDAPVRLRQSAGKTGANGVERTGQLTAPGDASDVARRGAQGQ